MNRGRFLSLTLVGLLYFSHLGLAQKSSASSSFEQLRTVLFQVKTSSGPTAEKNSYGSGFAVAKNGFILTNYHVVEAAIWKAPTEKVFVMAAHESMAADIVAVDVVHDLALIHVPLVFEKVISVSHALPIAGANLHSLGLPQDLDWTVINGIYNGVIQRGPYKLIHLTTPLNSGMSGGPTVNMRAELVGVNVSHLVAGENISFAVPLEFVKPLLEKARAFHDYKHVKTSEMLIEDVYRQLKSVQADLTALLLRTLDTTKTMEQWVVPKHSSEMKCWGHKSDASQKSYASISEQCELEHSTQLTQDIATGFVRIQTTLIKNAGLNFFSFFNMLNFYWGQDDINTDQLFSKNEKVNYGPFKCHENTISQGLEAIHVELCTRVLVPFTDLFEIHLKSMKRINTKNALISYIVLDGFNRENLQKILEKHLKNIGRFMP